MQLRTQKKYKGYGRRRLFGFPRRLFKLGIILVILWVGNWIVRYPELIRFIITDSAHSAQEGLSNAGEKIFPPAPTATPDTREETADGQFAYQTGNVDSTIENYREAIWGNPNDVQMHYILAHLLTITSNFGADTERMDEAIAVAQRGINANPESPLGWIALAMALDWKQDYSGALSAAERAVELAPNSPLVKGVIANIYRNLEYYDLAESALNDAITTLNASPNPSPEEVAQVYRNQARLLFALGDFEGAKTAYNRAYEALPSETYIAVELATRVYASLDDFQSAVTVLQKVRDTNPRDPMILFWLGYSHLRVGEQDSALDVLSSCVEVNPDNLGCVSMLGRTQYAKGLYVPAADNLKYATELGSTDPYDWYLLGRAYANTERCTEALYPFQTGYTLVLETPSSSVTADDFRTAADACGFGLQ